MYLCYNSFKAEWFWGPKHLSEPMFSPEITDKLINKFGGKEVIDYSLGDAWADGHAYVIKRLSKSYNS